ncbi:MAG: M1 family metallopeptidase [Calditrichaceae bacterium]|nr:M1 family metallopeptidase [Calditrichaceae bacterium]MBN2710227.1 M1 family metallopeptidase [Calditrichaceae bacterium]RQV96600.1 MAG: M1 family peptidase [Calditrichota bacterium]
MRFGYYLLLFYGLCAVIVNAQSLPPSSLYMPLDIKQAYDKNTRSPDGRPGSAYWQNHADYEIEVEVIPESRLVRGEEEITYFNNSPDTLKQLYIRLYQDIYRKGNTRDWPIHPDDIHDGVKINRLEVDGKKIDTESADSPVERRASNMIIDLKEPLHPASELNLEMEWEFTMPLNSNIRMGTYDSTTFFVGYWYPQIAVYDDIDSWDYYNYSGLQEFYNDQNNFDVKITVPNNFIVWATGVLDNPDKVLQDEYLKRYENAGLSENIVYIITAEDLGKQITKDNKKNVWRFKAEDVPDFTFAVSDHYLWDAAGLVVDKTTGRKVRIAAAYRTTSKDFYEVAEIARESIRFFSEKMPGWPFPYPELTVFNGHGGMESPMMVNDGSMTKRSGTVHVTSHEILHTYFPFFMGTNERKYAWMDEGWAVMLPFEIQMTLEPGYDPIANNTEYYVRNAGTELEMPIMIPSIIAGGNVYQPTYRSAAYDKPGVAFYLLRETLGDSLFKAALHEYISRWHYKHPIPYDFFFTFDETAGKRLDWFWKPWFFENGYPDLAIKDVFCEDGQAQVLIEKVGSLPVPVRLNISYTDSVEAIIDRPASVWSNCAARIMIKVDHADKIKSIELGGPYIPDVNVENNIYLFKNE